MAPRRAITIAQIGILVLTLLVSGHGKALGQTDISSDLMSCWGMEELSGTRYDSAGSQHLTDNNTVNRNRGIYRYGAEFISGNNENLSRNNNSVIHIGDASFEWAFWFYSASAPGDYSNFISKYGSGVNGEYLIYTVQSGKVEGMISDGTTATTVKTASVLTYPGWHFIDVWYDKDSQNWNLQADGGNIATAARTTGTKADDTSALLIGKNFSTIIDGVMFWKNRVLSTAERDYLYNGGFGRSCQEILTVATPTPSYRQDVILSSGNHLAIDRQVTYGDISIFVVVGSVFVLIFIFGGVRLIKLWF